MKEREGERSSDDVIALIAAPTAQNHIFSQYADLRTLLYPCLCSTVSYFFIYSFIRFSYYSRLILYIFIFCKFRYYVGLHVYAGNNNKKKTFFILNWCTCFTVINACNLNPPSLIYL